MTKKSWGWGAASLITAAIDIPLFWFPFVGSLLAIVAIILGIIAIAKKSGKTMGIAGLVLGILLLIVSLIMLLIISRRYF
ncbi:hypothetical protein ACFL0W_00430 [Nanoarchaeota archaeon]